MVYLVVWILCTAFYNAVDDAAIARARLTPEAKP